MVFFYGKMDDIGYWNRALSESEIQQLYASCTSPITLNNILDQNICSGESLTLTANATVPGRQSCNYECF